MAKILVIEWCDYISYPTGGHLSFARHMLGAFGSDLKLVGIDTTNECKVGAWNKRKIEGVEYDYYCVAKINKKGGKPFIPSRITAYCRVKKYIRDILKVGHDYIVAQTPEVLLALPTSSLSKVTLIMPGVENPIEFSRYKFMRRIADLYDLLYFRKASRVSAILPAADKKAISELLERSKGRISSSIVRQFPTRYDANIFRVKDSVELRKRYEIDRNVVLYVFVGRLNWIKGWRFLIDCFCKINNPDSRFVLIGDGEDETEIKGYISKCQVKERIVLLGKKTLDEVSDYLNMADVFVMGSYKEGWSTSLVEAVACACPCVVTDFSSASDMIEDGINGWVIKNRDEDEFAQRMKDAVLLDRSNLLNKASEISILSVQEMHEQMTRAAGWNY